MSRETLTWLNANTLIGFTEQRGKAWHYRASDQGDEPNHYKGAIPVEDVKRRLFDWEAVECPLYVELPEMGGMPKVPGRKAIVRSDTQSVLGIFADSYRPHQYSQWLLNNVSLILDDTLSIGSAGLLKDGAQGWVSIEVPETITTPEGVEFRPNLLACTSFDGSLATTYKRVVTNVVCDNTMTAGLSERGQQFKARHSRNSLGKLTEARDALAIVHTITDDFADEVRNLCRVTVTDRDWARFLDAFAPIPDEPGRKRSMGERRRDELTRLWNADERVSPWSRTAFGVLQAVNTYAHHHAVVRNTSRPERNMTRAVTGAVNTLTTDVLGTLQKVLA